MKSKRSKWPSSIKPQLATLVDKAPEGKDWLHEIKWDGYRLISFIKDKVQLKTRNNLDRTKDFKEIANELSKLKLTNTILDGEVVVVDKTGKSSFQYLQNAIKSKTKAPIIYYIFDMIYYQNRSIDLWPLIKRKALLKKIIPKNSKILKYSDHIIGQGSEVFKKACEEKLEGIISKNCQSPYVQKRTLSWLKVKCHQSQEFVIGGYTKPKSQRAYFGALLLGYYDKGDFKYCGRVGTGFNDRSLKEIYALLEQNKIKNCPFQKKIPKKDKDFASWVDPKIIIEVAFSQFTSKGILRHSSFKGIREDKKVASISLEATKKQKEFEFKITHPDRMVYPKNHISKLDVANYYYNIQNWILPHIINRPLAIVRCPEGLKEACFFQKHIFKNKKNQAIFADGTFIYIKNIAGLMELVQFGMLEIHSWGSRVDKPDKADRLTFDIDPGKGVTWGKIVATAFIIKEELEKYGLASFVKTTGKKGLHVVVPIIRRYNWEYVSLFAKTFSEYLNNKYPGEYASTMSKSKRNHKIYIDYLRNQEGATAIANYSTRAKEGALISIPLSWKELTQIQPSDFTINTVRNRLDKQIEDPWPDFFILKQKLPNIK